MVTATMEQQLEDPYSQGKPHFNIFRTRVPRLTRVQQRGMNCGWRLLGLQK